MVGKASFAKALAITYRLDYHRQLFIYLYNG
jgi:hypothetical protein